MSAIPARTTVRRHRHRHRLRLAAAAACIVAGLVLSACSKGGGALTLHGTITYRAQVGCAGDLASAQIAVIGHDGQVGVGKPSSVSGEICDERAAYSIPVSKEDNYSVSLRLNPSVTYSFGPFAFDTLEQRGFELDIRVVHGNPTTNPKAS